MLGIGHQEHGFDVGIEPLVHADHLEFVFEVGDRAQPAHDDLRADFPGVMDQQRVEGFDRDRRVAVAGQAARFRDAAWRGVRPCVNIGVFDGLSATPMTR